MRILTTPAELFQAEMEPGVGLRISACKTGDGRPVVRFAIGDKEVCYWPEDAMKIALAVMLCADGGKSKGSP